MREDDRKLDDVAQAVLAGRVSRDNYRRLWLVVMGERRREIGAECEVQECGHPWADGLRRWVEGQPTAVILCRICGLEREPIAAGGPASTTAMK
jgi:hypothetical protein